METGSNLTRVADKSADILALALIERCEASAENYTAREPIRPPATLESGR